jgi:hypothetical protein
MQRDERRAGLKTEFRGAPLAALHLQLLCTELASQMRFLNRTLNKRFVATQIRRSPGMRVACRSSPKSCGQARADRSPQLQLAASNAADFALRRNGCSGNAKRSVAKSNDAFAGHHSSHGWIRSLASPPKRADSWSGIAGESQVVRRRMSLSLPVQEASTVPSMPLARVKCFSSAARTACCAACK